MKPHHRASLLLGCLGLLVLYLPDGLRVAKRWPARPGLGDLGALVAGPRETAAAGPAVQADTPGRVMLSALPRPEGPPPPPEDVLTLDELVRGGDEDTLSGLQGGQ